MVEDPAELGDGLRALVEERVRGAEAEPGADGGTIEVDRLAVLLDRVQVLAGGEQRVALGLEAVDRRERGRGRRGRERGRLAGGERQHRRQEEERAQHQFSR
jgi:hypothetical protein